MTGLSFLTYFLLQSSGIFIYFLDLSFPIWKSYSECFWTIRFSLRARGGVYGWTVSSSSSSSSPFFFFCSSCLSIVFVFPIGQAAFFLFFSLSMFLYFQSLPFCPLNLSSTLELIYCIFCKYKIWKKVQQVGVQWFRKKKY